MDQFWVEVQLCENTGTLLFCKFTDQKLAHPNLFFSLLRRFTRRNNVPSSKRPFRLVGSSYKLPSPRTLLLSARQPRLERPHCRLAKSPPDLTN